MNWKRVGNFLIGTGVVIFTIALLFDLTIGMKGYELDSVPYRTVSFIHDLIGTINTPPWSTYIIVGFALRWGWVNKSKEGTASSS